MNKQLFSRLRLPLLFVLLGAATTASAIIIPPQHPNIGGLLPSAVRFGANFDPLDGVLAYDYTDGYMDNIAISGAVDTAVVGTTPLIYSVTNSLGDSKSVERKVTVLPEGEFAIINTTGRLGPTNIVTLGSSYLNTLATNVTFIKPVVTAIDGTEYHYKLIERNWDSSNYPADPSVPPTAAEWDAAHSKEFFQDLYLCLRPRLDRWLKIIVTNGSESREWIYGLKGDPGVLFHSELYNKDYYRLSQEVDDPQTTAEQFDAAYAHSASYWFDGSLPELKCMGGKADVMTVSSMARSDGAANERELHGIYTTIRAFDTGGSKSDGSDENWAGVERVWDHTLSLQMNTSFLRSYEIFFAEFKMPGGMDHFETTYRRIRTEYNPKRIYVGVSNYGHYWDYQSFYDVANPYFMFEWHKGHFAKMESSFPDVGENYPCYAQYPRINEVFSREAAAATFEVHRGIHYLAVTNRVEAAILDKCGFLGKFSDGTWAAFALPYYAMWFNYEGFDYLNTGYYFKDDWDGDGLSNADEKIAGSNPFHADTDGDGIFDGDEVAMSFDPTDPTDGQADSDGDRMSNFMEWLNSKGLPYVMTGTPAVDPVQIDDGNGGKIVINPNDPADGQWDPEGDLLPMWFELNTGGQPMELHTFKNGAKGTFLWYTDVGTEYAGMTKMIAYHNDILGHNDVDGDGITNLTELVWGMDPNDPSDATADWDGDGITNSDEIVAGTDPTGDDTDGPVFDAQVVRPPVCAFQAISAQPLCCSATAPDVGETQMFEILSGPSWLSSDSFGNLCGTPDSVDVGLNSWEIKVTDNLGRSDTSTLFITVQPGGLPEELASPFTLGSENDFVLRYQRDKNPSLRYSYQVSTDNENWSLLDIATDYQEFVAGASSSTEEVEVVLSDSFKTNSTLYIRLSLSTIPVCAGTTNGQLLPQADSYTIPDTGNLSVPAPGIQENDEIAEASSNVWVALVDAPTNGVVLLNDDGSFVYKPNRSASGDFDGDVFTYCLYDGVEHSLPTEVFLSPHTRFRLLAAWDFNETNGLVAVDISSNGWNVVLSEGSRTNGYADGAVLMTPSNSIAVNANWTPRDWTVSTRVLAPSSWGGGHENLLYTTNKCNLALHNWENGYVAYGHPDTFDLEFGYMLPSNQWVDLLWTTDIASRKLKLYVNGIYNSSVTVPTGYDMSLPAEFIGGVPGASFDGILDDLRIYAGSVDNATAQDMARPVDEKASAMAWWTFDESSGSTAYDETGSGHDIELPSNSRESGFIQGGFHLNAANTIALNAGWEDMMSWTVSAWVKPQASGGHQDLIRTPGVANLCACNWENGRVAYGRPHTYDLEFSYTLQPSTWTHLLWTANGSRTVRLYVNGTYNSSVTVPSGYDTPCPGALIGGEGSDVFDGVVDDLRVWNTTVFDEGAARIYGRSRKISYSQWSHAQWGQSLPENTTATNDFDGDGIANLAEFFLGLDPATPNTSNDLHDARLSISATNGICLHHYRRNNTTLRCRYQVSSDLQSWSNLVESVDFEEADRSLDLTSEAVDLRLLSPDENAGFFRILIEDPEE